MKELRRASMPPPKPEDPGRLAPDQPVWEVDGEARGAEAGRPRAPERLPQPESVPQPEPLRLPAGAWRPAPARRWGRGRSLLAIALALGMFAGGIGVGSALAGRSTRLGTPAATPPAGAVATTAAPTAAPTTTAPARQVAPPACLSAVDDADAAISYLVAGVRDQRLARMMQRYRAASGICRRAS